jgi:hypothetical protein
LIRTDGKDCITLQLSFSRAIFYLFYWGEDYCASALNATKLSLRVRKLTSQESSQCAVIIATFGGTGIVQG